MGTVWFGLVWFGLVSFRFLFYLHPISNTFQLQIHAYLLEWVNLVPIQFLKFSSAGFHHGFITSKYFAVFYKISNCIMTCCFWLMMHSNTHLWFFSKTVMLAANHHSLYWTILPVLLLLYAAVRYCHMIPPQMLVLYCTHVYSARYPVYEYLTQCSCLHSIW